MDENTPSDFGLLAEARVAVAGLGLMGGSLALALRGKCQAVIGVDNDPDVIRQAAGMKLAATLGNVDAGLLEGADLVVLAAPISGILDLLARLPDLHHGKAVVVDLASTKSEIVQAMERLPGRFDPMGGHPMCGKEKGSLAYSEAGLYAGAPFALVPLNRTSGRARRLVSQMVQAVGASPLWMAAATHDWMVAATSHLPFLVANVLAAMTPPEAAPLAGPGFRSTTRVGETDAGMMTEIMRSNRDNILLALAGYRSALGRLEAMLSCGDWEQLRRSFELGASRRRLLWKTQEGLKKCN